MITSAVAPATPGISASDNPLTALAMLASALAGHALRVELAAAHSLGWTDGSVIYLQAGASHKEHIRQLCVQCALLAAGSFDPDILRRMTHRRKLAQRYLAIEAPRALASITELLPPAACSALNADSCTSDSPTASFQLAMSASEIPAPAEYFGELHVKELLANLSREGGASEQGSHTPRKPSSNELSELPDDANDDNEDSEDNISSPVGGGGGLGKALQRFFQMVRRLKGGGEPGADAASHWTRSGSRGGVRTVKSHSQADPVADAFGTGTGRLYPEWDDFRQCYRPDWCVVEERSPLCDAEASVAWLDGIGLKKPLARLGMGLDRCHRQNQGDDLDIDALIESHIDLAAGGAGDDAVYIESQRHRRDLSVLVLLDISGSVSQTAHSGISIHNEQRKVAAALATVLHEIGDRIALYAFHSQGRKAVHVLPVKRFDQNLDSAVMSRLQSLKPGAYSRLGAAIRHTASELIDHSGTPRKLLVVLSDGLAYDHGYEPDYGAADARQALAEARRDGVGCMCLSVGAHTDSDVLKKVFGSAAHAIVSNPQQITHIIGPLFQAALRNAETQRRFGKQGAAL